MIHIQGLSIIIPAYNEEKSIGKVVENLREALDHKLNIPFETIVVDDGSTDGTAKMIQSAEVKVLQHPKNLGYGKSILAGMEHAQYELIGIMDADATYDPLDLLKMIPLADSSDMVVGVRDMRQFKESYFVKFLRVFLKSIILFFSGHFSPDPNSGMRIFRKKTALEGKHLFSMKFSFSTSLTFFSHLTGRSVEYIPIQYYSRVGFSKVRHVRDSFKTLLLVLRMGSFYKPGRYFLLVYLIPLSFIMLITLLLF